MVVEIERNNGISRERNEDLFILTNLKYENCAPKAMKYLFAYPGPWEWIKTGVEPPYSRPLGDPC
jgi:hypothetical protein